VAVSPAPTRDTRLYPRIPLEMVVTVSDAAKRVRKPIRLSSVDLSGGGTFLRADILFEVGEVLVLEFQLPDGHLIRTRGRVVRVSRGGPKLQPPGMGIEFIDLPAEDRAAIETRSS
jgi:uncharacterized protein (TIGR02266 family)